jgi:hypothetical protein
MMDIFSFPRILGKTPEEQIAELVSYLIQFKETLEFTLMNISTDNLSPDLVKMLNDMGANIEQSNENRAEEVAQLSNNTTLTIADVCNSQMFQNAVKGEVANVKYNVNFETGNLEYTVSEEGG